MTWIESTSSLCWNLVRHIVTHLNQCPLGVRIDFDRRGHTIDGEMETATDNRAWRTDADDAQSRVQDSLYATNKRWRLN